MYIPDLFSYQANLNKMLAQIDMSLRITFNCEIHLYEGIVDACFINIDTPVESMEDIQQALMGDAEYYFKSSSEFDLDDSIISVILGELEFAKIDSKKQGDFRGCRYDYIRLLEEDDYDVNCSFLLEIINQ